MAVTEKNFTFRAARAGRCFRASPFARFTLI
jgi:hypothetical protein